MGAGTGGGDLPHLGAVVKYTVTLNESVPDNTTLIVSVTPVSYAPAPSALQCNGNNLTDTEAVDVATITGAHAWNISGSVSCTFEVTVGANETAAGSIPGYTVDSQYQANGTDAFTNLSSLAVPSLAVYTGSTLTVTTALNDGEVATNYFPGMAVSDKLNKHCVLCKCHAAECSQTNK